MKSQEELSKETGYSQGDVSKLLTAIRELSFVPKRIQKVLSACGWVIKIEKQWLSHSNH